MPLHRRLPKRGFTNIFRQARRGRARPDRRRRSTPASSMPAQTIDAAALKQAGVDPPRQGRRAPSRRRRARSARSTFDVVGGARVRRSPRSRRPAARSRSRRQGGGGGRPPDPYVQSGAGGNPERHGLSSRTACRQSQLRRLLQGGGAEEAHLVHARRAAHLSARHLHPAAGHRPRRRCSRPSSSSPPASSACSTCSPAAPSSAWRSSRSASCRTSRPRSSCS